MTIGFCRVILHLPDVGSLKQKRSVIKSLVARIRQKFNVSVSEIEEQDVWQKAVLGVAVVATDRDFAGRVLNKAVGLIEDEQCVHLIDLSIEML